jgi:ribosome biogenesis GTPase
VNEVTGRGRHTSTSAFALPISPAGWIIDTQGIRSFGIAHVSTEVIESAFTDLKPFLSNCLKSCQHLQTDCGLAEIPATDSQLIKRADSLRRLITSTTS